MRKNQYNQVDDDFDHGVFFLGVPFGDHKGEGYEGVIGDALGPLHYKNAVENNCSIYDRN